MAVLHRKNIFLIFTLVYNNEFYWRIYKNHWLERKKKIKIKSDFIAWIQRSFSDIHICMSYSIKHYFLGWKPSSIFRTFPELTNIFNNNFISNWSDSFFFAFFGGGGWCRTNLSISFTVWDNLKKNGTVH